MNNDGGPAFPVRMPRRSMGKGGPSTLVYGGMSLRDLFAAVALHAIVTRGGGGIPEVPGEAYEYADKMLKERDK